ncbi:hypothetical protein [Streptomyces sp. R41]|uniref:Uncharacterized protein n=1 Tax=Streptomyces sp. R41 TaxID=3238632 RepID=A0AB39S085_9ACTN
MSVVGGVLRKAPASDDDPRHLDETRQYLKDTEELSAVARHAKEFTDLMALRHLARINPTVLFLTAEHPFPAPPSTTGPLSSSQRSPQAKSGVAP